jgi:peptide/nickel transport system substrate-binding protein
MDPIFRPPGAARRTCAPRLRRTPRGVLLSSGMTVLVILAAACGGGGPSPSGSSAPALTSRLVSTAPPGRGDVSEITWDLPNGEPTTLDYVKAGDYGPDMIISNLCDDLFRLDPKWGERPEIAQSYSYPSPTTLILNIRHGVRFWDGHPLTAADVANSLQRNMEPSTGAVNGGFFTTVRSIQQTGPYQVTVRFRKPDELFIKELATVVGAVAEKAYVQKTGNKSFGTSHGGVMCSGPYELQSWTPGQQLVLTRNPRYWDGSLQPKIGKVVVKFISDTSSLTSALRSGEIDGAYEVPAISIPALRHSATGNLYFGPSLEIEQFQSSTTTGPAANPKVREALGISIDRAAIAQKIYFGAAAPNKTLTPPSAWDPAAKSIYQAAYDKLPGFTPDFAAAKKLIADVPGKDQPIVLAIQAGDQTSINLATLIQENAAQIGLHVRIKEMQPLDFSNLFYLPQYRKGIDIVLSNGFLDVPDQLDYLAYWIYPDSYFNWIKYDDTTVQRLADEALTTFNPRKRAQLLTAAQARYMKNYQIVTPIVSVDEITYLSKKLGGATTSFAYIFEPSFAYIGAR